jgi:hypothetical protein
MALQDTLKSLGDKLEKILKSLPTNHRALH